MENTFSHKFLRNLIYSLCITCLIMGFIVNHIYTLVHTFMETRPASRPVAWAIRLETPMIIGFVLFGIVLFVFIFWIFHYKEFESIQKISAGIKEISDGNLSNKIEVAGDDEFAEMADKLNAMVQDLRDLMERERESERQKNEFITSIAHDLRTPLTSIIGYLAILENDPNGVEESKRINYIHIAYTKSIQLQKLIEEFFGFTKLSHHGHSMDVSKIDIVQLLAQLVEEFYPSFQKHKLEFSLKTNISSKMITGDPNLLVRLFGNLISNAIKYGADGKMVDIKIEDLGEKVRISVKNFGNMIPEAELPLIFEKFYRLEQSRSSETGGTGLGLAIVKQIVEMHGGKVNVKSDLNGTVFEVVLQTNFDINKENFTNV